MANLSTFTSVPTIAERSEATPGLWNAIFSVISQNVDQLNADVGSGSSVAISTNTINAASGSTVLVNAVLSTNTWAPQSGNTVRVVNAANLIARSYDSGGAWFDVRAFGAMGDDATDDTAALRSTFSAAQAIGGVAYLSTGTYRTTSTLTITGRMTLTGAGRDRAVLRPQAGVGGIGANTLSFASTAATQALEFSNFGIDHSLNTLLTGLDLQFFEGYVRGLRISSGSVGISMRTCVNSLLDDIVIRNCDGSGIYLSGDSNGENLISHVEIGRSSTGTTTAGFRVERTTGADPGGLTLNNIRIVNPGGNLVNAFLFRSSLGTGTSLYLFANNCYGDSANQGDAWSFQSMAEIRLSNSWGYANGAASGNWHAIRILGGSHLQLSGNYVSSVNSSDLGIYGNTGECVFANNMFSQTGSFNVYLDSVAKNNLHFYGNLFRGVSTNSTPQMSRLAGIVTEPFMPHGMTIWVAGGGGAADTLRIVERGNTASSNVTKHIRVNTSGALEVIDAAFANVLLTIPDAGGLQLGPMATPTGQLQAGTVAVDRANNATSLQTITNTGPGGSAAITVRFVGGPGQGTVPIQEWRDSSLNVLSQISGDGTHILKTGTAIQPSSVFTSEQSLGWYRSAASVMALSYGGLALKSQGAAGANASCGTAVLGSVGSVNVANSYVAAGDLIFLTDQAPGGTLGDLEMGGIRAGSGFTIQSTSVTDTSTVAWLIVRPLGA